MSGTTAATIVMPAGSSPEALRSARNLPVFAPAALEFAAALGTQLTSRPEARAYPELVALGFWLRPANVQRLRESFLGPRDGRTLLPRGLAFHVAPANVDTIFVYSWMLSLLAGNRNLIRLSSRESAQGAVLHAALRSLLEAPEWREIAVRTCLLRYGYDDRISTALSAACDLRIVWGGDATVRALRALPLSPHAIELTFANKVSACVLGAAAVAALDAPALASLATAFVNDAYSFGQLACSSPRLVFWLGDEVASAAAAQVLWPAVLRALDARGATVSPAESMDKVVAADSLAIEADGARIDAADPRLTRVILPRPMLRDDLHCGAGLFHESRIAALDDLLPLLSRRVQTVSYHGVGAAQWRAFAQRALPAGIDRIVPVGQALDFDTTWDGAELLASLTREIVIRPEVRR